MQSVEALLIAEQYTLLYQWEGQLIITQGPFRNHQIQFTILLTHYPSISLRLAFPFHHPYVRDRDVDVHTLLKPHPNTHSHIYPLLNNFKAMFMSSKMLSNTTSFNPSAARQFKFKRGLYLEKAYRTLSPYTHPQHHEEVQERLKIAMERQTQAEQIQCLVSLMS